MTVFSGVIGAQIKLALFSHTFDKKRKKIIITDIIAESKDDEFLTENYLKGEKQDKLDTEKLIKEFLIKYGDKIQKEILCVSMAIQGPVEGEKGELTASVSRPPNLQITFHESDFQKKPISYAKVVFLNDID